MTKLICTSVVRGSEKGESHGGVYIVDFEALTVDQKIDWNRMDIDWAGRGWDRGLRGIAIDGEHVYIAASDEIFCYSPDFKLLASYKNPYLKHAHEMWIHKRMLYVASTGFDAILGFHLDAKEFVWGIHAFAHEDGYKSWKFDPRDARGPMPCNEMHINSVCANDRGLFFSGLRIPGLLKFDGEEIHMWVDHSLGTHNSQPFKNGLLFNDTKSDHVRFASPDWQCAFKVPELEPERITHLEHDDGKVARIGFGRGLCAIDNRFIASGSSPSTIALHDLHKVETVRSVTISWDVRNAIHGLEVWPF